MGTNEALETAKSVVYKRMPHFIVECLPAFHDGIFLRCDVIKIATVGTKTLCKNKPEIYKVLKYWPACRSVQYVHDLLTINGSLVMLCVLYFRAGRCILWHGLLLTVEMLSLSIALSFAACIWPFITQ